MSTDPGTRRVALAGAGTVAGLVLLLAYPTSLNRAGTAAPAGAAPATTAPTTPRSSVPRSSVPRSSAPRSSAPRSSAPRSSAPATSGTVTGDAVDTRWGPVQVEITVAGGRITAARTVQVPDGNDRDAEINDYAVPILNQEAVAAGSAQIDAVSGATVTSDGYTASLQSAIDRAHL